MAVQSYKDSRHEVIAKARNIHAAHYDPIAFQMSLLISRQLDEMLVLLSKLVIDSNGS